MIVRPRGGGKTWLSVRMLRLQGEKARLVVPTAQHRDWIIEQYKLTPQEQKQVIVARERVLQGYDSREYTLVDGADTILQQFLGRYIDYATWNGGEK